MEAANQPVTVEEVRLRGDLETAILDLLSLADVVDILLMKRYTNKVDREFAQRRLDRMRQRYTFDGRFGPQMSRHARS